MAAVTIRNLPDETHRALKQLAAENGRSMEAEIRAILYRAVTPAPRLQIGAALAAFGRELGGLDFNVEWDRTPVAPIHLE